MAELKVCKQCGVTERRRSSTQRDKFINSGTLDVDYPICRKCDTKLKRKLAAKTSALLNAASTMDDVLTTEVVIEAAQTDSTACVARHASSLAGADASLPAAAVTHELSHVLMI